MSQSPLPQKYFNNTSQTNNFDEVPIGTNANKFLISQYANQLPNQNLHEPVSSKNMSLLDKIQSKVVKIKLEGLQQLKVLLGNNEISPQIQFELSKILKQNNPACLQKALQCAQKWIQVGRPYGQKQIKQIIENGYLNGKGNTKKLASDLIFKSFQTKTQDVQRTIIQTGLKSKVPKTLGCYLAILNELLDQFGVKDLKYLKPYIPLTISIMNNEKLPIVKQQGINFLKSGLKWLGKDFLWPLYSELKQNMKKQLESFWEGHDKKQVMKAKRQKSTSVVNHTSTLNKTKSNTQKFQNEVKTGNQGFDIYQISDPIDIISKFDEKWSQTVLETQKWNTKTTMLQQIISKASVPKIANTQHRHLTQMIRRLLNDSNFNVVLSALKLAGALAKGLRKNFTHSAKILFPFIIPKFRDKKTQMIDETFNALNNFFYCFSIEQVGEDVKAGLKDKAAGMKTNITKWMINCIDKKQTQNNFTSSERMLQFIKSSSMSTLFQSLLNDPNAQVRDVTAKFVCKIRNVFGEGIFKNLDKNINNKEIIQRLSQNLQNQQQVSKSRGKDTSSKKLKSNSKNKSSKKNNDDQQDINKNSYSFRLKGNQGLDITQQLNKNMKKLNDNSNWQNRKQSAEKLIKFFNHLQKQSPNVKISSSVLLDFLGILKARIADPNKQLIKVFVSLIGYVFQFLAQKQAKIQSKSFIQELMEAFSDKNEANRKQIFKTLDRIASSIGYQTILTYFGQLLVQQSGTSAGNQIVKQYTLEYLNSTQYFNNKIDQIEGPNNLKQLKQFPKIILSGLCDKSKDLRAISQRIFKLFYEKTGIQLFRSFVHSKQQKIMYKNDLIAFLDKFEGLNATQQPSTISYLSNGSMLSINIRETDNLSKSPSINKSKIPFQQNTHSEKAKRKLSNALNLNNSRSKAKNYSAILGTEQNSKDCSNQLIFGLKSDNRSIVQGNQLFASLQFLTSQRVQRQENANKYRNKNSHPITQQFEVQSSLSRMVNYEEIFIKMMSNDYNKNIQASNKLIKMCRDVAQTNSIRQISDLVIKWITIKLYGGNITALGLIQLVCPVLTVLQKKKIAWTDYDIDLLIFLMRQYLFACFYEQSENFQILKNMLKLTIMLSSGERLVRKILSELKLDISQQHRHLVSFKKQSGGCNRYYKKVLCQLCGFLVDYFSNDRILQQAAGIQQLSQDYQFIRLLANKFHQGVLKQFGFRLQTTQSNFASSSVRQNPINLERSFYNAEKNNLVSPRNPSPGIAFFGVSKSKNQQKEKKQTPQKTINAPLTQSRYPPPSPLSKTRFLNQSYAQQQNQQNFKIEPTINSIYKNVGIEATSNRYEIDLSGLPQPNQHNPLGSNLLRLFPYNQSSIHFFNTLFQPQNQNSDKITSELSLNCNLIYGYLFNTLMKMMELPVRQAQGPERVANFTSLVQQSIKCPSIFRNLNEQIIQKSIKYIIDQLVYEDENRNNIESKLRARGYNDFKSDIFVKGINGVMLRLLDNSYPLLLVNSLLLNLMEVLVDLRHHQETSHLHNVNKSKKIGLIIRCFLRVINCYFNQSQHKQKQTQVYNVQQDPSCLKTHHIHKFILLSREYLQIMQITNLISFQIRQQKNSKTCENNNQGLQNNEEAVAISICKILKLLQKKNLVIKNYEYLKKQKSSLKEQRVLSEYISMISGTGFNQQQMAKNNHNSSGLTQNNGFVGGIPMDEQFKRIIQMLSKSKSFNDGVKSLKQYIQQFGGKFDYRSIFMKLNFQLAFIEKVAEQLNKINVLSSQSSSRSLNPDIQNKLQRLKMKLQGINNDHSKSITQKDLNQMQRQKVVVKGSSINVIDATHKRSEHPTPKGRDLSTKSIQPQTSHQNDLKRRIEQMKNKVNMSTTNKIR